MVSVNWKQLERRLRRSSRVGAHDRNMCRRKLTEVKRRFLKLTGMCSFKTGGFCPSMFSRIERQLMSGKTGNCELAKMELEDVNQNGKIKDGKILSVRYNTQFNLDFQCLLLCVYWRDGLAIIV